MRRDRLLVASGVVIVSVLAWLYVLWLAADMNGVGMDMAGMRMIPAGLGLMAPAATPWSVAEFVLVFLMWAVMMIAMMTPSAAPMMLMYARAVRQGNSSGKPLPATAWFAAGYFLAWAGFSFVATTFQWVLDRQALMDARMASASRVVGAIIVIAAGIYQWTPLKDSCLAQCQSPFRFLLTHGGFRSDPMGCLRLGLVHGTYCVGCCWILMGLLFVVGVMNVLWIALLICLVLMEKLAPFGNWTARLSGAVCIGVGVWMAFGAASARS